MIGFYDYTVLATYAATALGVTGMFQAVEGRHLTAVFCLLAAGLLDCFDGRIARTKKDRSHQQQSFGIQIDSLNDVLCFGALPSVAGYCAWSRWSDAPTPVWYGAALCVFTLAGLIRLAYFNVTEEERQQTEGGGRKYYLGLPITASALVFPLFYLLGLLLPGRAVYPGGRNAAAGGAVCDPAAHSQARPCRHLPSFGGGSSGAGGADPGRFGAAVTGRSPVHI